MGREGRGPFGTDSELRSYGLRIQARGGKIAKKKSYVAVARKLVTVMLALWKNPDIAYDPNFKKIKDFTNNRNRFLILR